MNTRKQLYVVVHHPQDPHKPYVNHWLDDDRLDTITTTAEIGEICKEAMERGERVFVHRCGYGDSQPLVCCSLRVVQSAPIDRRVSVVMFGEQELLNASPPFSPHHGQNYYRA